jgi:hypothetical protein
MAPNRPRRHERTRSGIAPAAAHRYENRFPSCPEPLPMTDAATIIFTPITQELFLADIEAVALRIEQEPWRPDYIVGIGRGGLVPGAYLSHRTGIPLLSIDHSSKVYDFSEKLLVQIA